MKRSKTGLYLAVITFCVLAVDLYLVFLWVPSEMHQGIVQRIFYFHVPSAWAAFVGLFGAFLGSAWYLWKRDDRLDQACNPGCRKGVADICFH